MLSNTGAAVRRAAACAQHHHRAFGTTASVGAGAGAERPRSRTVLIDGTRIPFMTSGTAYSKLIAQDLGRMALKGLLTKTAWDPAKIDYLIMGTVIQEVRTSNLARECGLGAGIPDSVPAHTVTMACISANQAAATAAAMINSGQAEVAVVGGAETMSDVPIRFHKEMRKRLIKLSKYKGPADLLPFFKGFKLAYLAPEAPAIAEFSTGEVMGHSSDRLAARWGVSREEQDDLAFRSHALAAKAHKEGLLEDEITAVDGNVMDNGVKENPREKYATLKPAFVKPHGTHTAANSSFLTDGGSAALLMSEDRALREGLAPKARLVDTIFVSQDPKDELLLGPAYATTRLLHRNGLSARDVDVFEIHEAFAGQVGANLKAMDSEAFVTGKVGLPASAKVGAIPLEKMNAWGGSLAIGHPFGATGTRLITTSANRLIKTGGRYAVLTACAAGGQAVAMLLERYVAPAGAAAKPVIAPKMA